MTKTRRITITVPATILNDIEWLAPLEDMTRDQLIVEAIRRFLKPHLEIRKRVLKTAREIEKQPSRGPLATAAEMAAELKRQLKKRPYRITKAIAQSTDQFQTGRYEGPEQQQQDAPINRSVVTASRRNPKLVLAELAQAIDELRQDAKENGVDKTPMSEINRAVTAMRRDLKKSSKRSGK